MGWPEAVLGVIVSFNALLGMWLAERARQVKRDLNGAEDHLVDEVQQLRFQIERVFQLPPTPDRSPPRRGFPPM